MLSSSPSTVFITGANRGIGLALARQFAEQGWSVIAATRRVNDALELRKLADTTKRLSIYELDVSDHKAIEHLARELSESEVGRKIDILINNAGIIGEPANKPQSFGQIDYTRWREAFEVNTLAPTKITECFIDHVARSERKVLGYISSIMGSMSADRSGGYYAYRSSKAALNRVVRSLLADIGPRGFVPVVLHPGWVQTDMGGTNADITPEQSAKGLFKVLTSLTRDDAGRFIDYAGKEVAW